MMKRFANIPWHYTFVYDMNLTFKTIYTLLFIHKSASIIEDA